MKKTLAILATVATVAATSVTAPAQARGIGPGLAFGLAAGAIAAGAAGAYGYYGPGYGYYGPRYYGPAYYGPGYAYYGGPYWRHRYWHHYWRGRKARNSLPGFLLAADQAELMGESPAPYLINFGISEFRLTAG